MVEADRLNNVELSGIRRLFELANSTDRTIVNLGLGEPDFSPPRAITDALQESLKSNTNRYGPTNGIRELRDMISEWYHDLDNSTTYENVMVTNGATEGLMSIAMSLFNDGDHVLVPDPGFVLYPSHVRIAGALPVVYTLTQSNNYIPDVYELEKIVDDKTVAIYINNPSNPLGTVMDEDNINELIKFAKKHNLIIISDEVYDRITYDSPAISFWGKYENVIVCNSFSKTLSIPGWRVGYILTPPKFSNAIKKMHYYTSACPVTPFQYAIVNGWDKAESDIKRNVQEFKNRRELVVSMLKEMKLSFPHPSGAFYVFPEIPEHIKMSSENIAKALVDKDLLTSPGSAFGMHGENHIRFSFSNSRENIKKGLNIFKKWIEEME